MSHGSSTKAIFYALAANGGIAVAKTGAAVYTGSGSMLAEAIHSYADCGNQLLLLLGMKRSALPPSDRHPLGSGKASYFWSFLVAIMLFSMGGLFSIYEGVHKLHETEPVHDAWVALVVLGFSILLEAGSMAGCVKEVNALRGSTPLWTWLKRSRHAELVVVFGEDLAALVGLVLAFTFLSVASLTGDPIFDALGSIAIGIVLLVVSVFVAIRVKQLLIGTSVDPDVERAIADHIRADAGIEALHNLITLQLGPKFMLAAKVGVAPELPVREAAEAVNRLEESLHAKFPDLQWSFVEIDVRD